MHRLFFPLVTLAAVALGSASAHADPVAAHALIVGSNAAGPGRETEP